MANNAICDVFRMHLWSLKIFLVENKWETPFSHRNGPTVDWWDDTKYRSLHFSAFTYKFSTLMMKCTTSPPNRLQNKCSRRIRTTFTFILLGTFVNFQSRRWRATPSNRFCNVRRSPREVPPLLSRYEIRKRSEKALLAVEGPYGEDKKSCANHCTAPVECKAF